MKERASRTKKKAKQTGKKTAPRGPTSARMSPKPSPSLALYQRKRNFQRTPEPSADVPAPRKPAEAAQALSFMVHKHDATRMHYDLRLEMDGVLASWAIPKGPSYDPSTKRLAVQTEDHPLAYATFEGRIPDGAYGAGDSIIWDRGTYDTVPPGRASEQRKKGHLHIRLQGEKLVGDWHLVRTRPQGNREAWLCFKAKDGREDPSYDVVESRPESVHSGRRITRGPVRKKTLRASHPTPDALLKKVWPPMLATLSSVERIDEPQSYRLELKYDGYRGIAAISGGKVAFETRNAIDLSARFPKLAKALSELSTAECVLDGEVVALDKSGVSRFQLLHDPSVEHRFVAFDLLWLDGEDLRERPLEERRELLESVLANTPLPLQLSEVVNAPMDDALEAARENGLEGLIAKRLGSKYVGKRSDAWLKLKVLQSQEVAIVGFTPMSNGKKELGALIIAVHDGKGFRYVGKVGTGYSSEVRRELRKALEQDVVETSSAADAPRMRDAIWVEPRYVAQVVFTEWTEDGRLRHPSFQGLRMDKKPEECRREELKSGAKKRSGRAAAAKRSR